MKVVRFKILFPSSIFLSRYHTNLCYTKNMTMKEAIESFAEQFNYEPEMKNGDNFRPNEKLVVVGMGGSALAPGLVKVWEPKADIIIHKSYGLPAMSAEDLKKRLVILSSYSGNTEEVLEAYEEAKTRNLSRLVIASGGVLMEEAKKDDAPYIELPKTGIQPRSALGFGFKAFLKAMGKKEALKDVGALAKGLKPKNCEEEGKTLAEKMENRVPVIYSSDRNLPIIYNWKIKLNETGKIPAFCNVLPELNHNEMTGFDARDSSRHLSENFFFVILRNENDHPKILKRMSVLEKLYRDRGLSVFISDLKGEPEFLKIFSSLVLADWTAYYTAEIYGLDPNEVPMVEEFKRLVKKQENPKS